MLIGSCYCRVSAGVRSLYNTRAQLLFKKKCFVFVFVFFNYFSLHFLFIYLFIYYAVFVLPSLLLRARSMFYLINQVCLLSRVQFGA